MKMKLFSYSQLDTYIHHLSGFTKLICFLLLTTTVMLSYDIRVIIGVLILSLICFRIAKIEFKQVKLMFIYVSIFLITNFILTFIFAPTRGVNIYGSQTVLISLFGNFDITLEQIFFQVTKLLKYLSVIPLGMIFFFTTNPSAFASSLNKAKVNYKACTVLSLTLRYFPDVTRDYHTISLANQARGIEMSSKAKLKDRLKHIIDILIPLIFTTLDRIDIISCAMELRGYGKLKKRSWYSFRPLDKKDYFAITICSLVFIGSILITMYINKSIYYNPFI
ncbi:MAG: energy-coupling factor transporter transmembrane component T family protein [Anaerorhabdus sp.]